MSRHSYQSGFSAVELLITLFIAAAFLMTGYQLYTVIIRDSGDARQRSRASMIAYDYLRQYAAKVPATCTTLASWHNEALTNVEGLVNVSVSVSRTCPYTTTLNDVSKVQVAVSYGTESQEVVHAIYARRP